MGADVAQAPKKGYVSLRRRKQFAMLQPGAKWVNLGLILPERQPEGRFEDAAKWTRCSRTAFGSQPPRRSMTSWSPGFDRRTTPLF